MNCEKCHIGHYRQISAPYLRWLDGQIMIIPDSPAYACDMCDDMVYDISFLNKLETLLDQLVGDVQINEPALQHMMTEEFVSWQSYRRSR
jgi:hypothetical protein